MKNLIKLILVCFACFLILSIIALMIPDEWLETCEPQEHTEEMTDIVPDEPQEEIAEEAPEPDPSSVEWYVGGTLHGSTMGEWNQAVYENKLATCGDFVAKRTYEISKDKAEELVICIDEAGKGLVQDSTVAVTDMAATCILLMGY